MKFIKYFFILIFIFTIIIIIFNLYNYFILKEEVNLFSVSLISLYLFIFFYPFLYMNYKKNIQKIIQAEAKNKEINKQNLLKEIGGAIEK